MAMNMYKLLFLSVLLFVARPYDEFEVTDDDSPSNDDSSSNKEVTYNYEDDVLVLDEGNFYQAVKKHQYMLLEFYAPWCGHCQKLEPEYSKAAKALKDEGIVLAKVDASVHRKLSDKEGCKGYPTLKFLTEGHEVPFTGGRTADGIQQWIWSHINPGSEQLNTTSEVQDAIDQNEIIFFYFADDVPKDGKDREFRRYKEFSYSIMGTKFAHTHETGIRENFKIGVNTNFVVFKKTDQRLVQYSQTKLKNSEMKAFVELNSLPRIINLDDKWDWLKDRIFIKERPVLLHFTDDDKLQKEYLKQASYAYPSEDYLLFVQVDSDDSPARDQLLELLQIQDDDAVGFFIASKNGALKFKLPQAEDKNTILQFISDWKDGKAQRYFRSQDTPKESTGPVKSLVGRTYQNLVLESNQDIVVLYYDSKNEEHQSVQKQFESIALRLKNNSLQFGKIDISQNEVNDMQDSVEVTKVRLYKGSSPRENVKFVLRANKIQDERLIKWIREHSNNEIADPKGDL